MTLAITQKKIVIKTRQKKMLADTSTPVSIYLKLRDHFGVSVLLESTDFNSRENCHSYICVDPISTFCLENNELSLTGELTDNEQLAINKSDNVPALLHNFIQQHSIEQEDKEAINGFFGHTSFDAVQYFDTIDFPAQKRATNIPDIQYSLFRYIISINHFKDEMTILENYIGDSPSTIEKIETLIQHQSMTAYKFELKGEVTSNIDDETFRDLVRKGKQHCQLGDVFQVVFSRRFEQKYYGDDFNVYRKLRSVNPSPYLFYFDYGSYRIFGSSPESQLEVKNNIASVNPIAGTYRRTGDDAADQEKVQELLADPKENAEHIMLVDLARNDLSKHANAVHVAKLKEIQFFSHVIHLVSKVEGELKPTSNSIEIFADTFPAGTLSGAPKYKAIELINSYENINRGFYGGAIGFINSDGAMNQAIIIRSFLSQNNTLSFQAGAGIVAASDPEKELQEVNHKLAALRKAMMLAQQL